MPQVKCRFRRHEMTRAIKGVEAAGLTVASVVVDNDGRITIVPGTPQAIASESADDVLERCRRDKNAAQS